MANAKIKRFWYVIPNDIQGQVGQLWYGPPNTPRRGDALLDPEPARAQPRAARDQRGNRIIEEDVEVTNSDDGYGLPLQPKEQKEVMAFSTLAKAQEYAKYQATMHPQRLFGVFACEQLFETTEPTVLQKKFNEAGELVLDSGV